MSSLNEIYDVHYLGMLRQATSLDPESDEATVALKNLETLSKCRPPKPPEPEPVACEPQTMWQKVEAKLGRVWDNETTRTVIKAGGTFAGVALVVWSTVHKDKVIERQALAQANQRSN